MPIATAIWLVENTTLTFEQIANFCGMHEMEIQSIADGEIGGNIIGANPITAGQLNADNIKACEADPKKRLNLIEIHQVKPSKKKVKYIPIAKRRDKPDAIAWLIKNYPDLADSKITKLIGTTKNTIVSIRNRTHSKIQTIQAKDPVLLGLCTQTELDEVVKEFKVAEEA